MKNKRQPKMARQSLAEQVLESELAASREHQGGRGYWAPGSIQNRLETARRRVRVERIEESVHASAEALDAFRGVLAAAENLFGVLVRKGQIPDLERAADDMVEVLRRGLTCCPFDAETYVAEPEPTNVIAFVAWRTEQNR